MADSDTTIDQISPGMAQKEVVVNANFDAASPSMGYGRRASTTEALTWGYHEAILDVAGVPTKIPAGTIALTASATNYLYRTSAGVVTKATSPPAGWPGPLAASAAALYEIVTGAATVTSYIDHRLTAGGPGLSGAPGADGADGAPGADGADGADGTHWALTVNAQTGTTYTLQATDNGKVVTLSNASAITLTVPAGLGANFACEVIQIGAGAVTVSPSSVTLNSYGARRQFAGQHVAATLVAYAAGVQPGRQSRMSQVYMPCVAGPLAFGGGVPAPIFFAPLLSSLVPTIAGGSPTATFTRATTATATGVAAGGNAADGQSVLVCNAGEARFQGARRISASSWSEQYADGSAIPHAVMLGYVAENAGTNLCKESQTFDVAATWPPLNATITANAQAAPDGTMTADVFTDNATSGAHEVRNGIVFSTVAYTFSVYLKAGTLTWAQVHVFDGATSRWANFNLVTGAVGNVSASTTATITSLTNGWYRCVITFTSSSSTGGNARIYSIDTNQNVAAPTYAGTGQTMFLWGAQVETGANPSSYIPTTTVATTRNEDVLQYPMVGNLSGATGTTYVEYYPRFVGTLAKLVLRTMGPPAAAPQYFAAATPSQVTLFASGANVAGTVNGVTVGAVNKMASAWSGTAAAVCLNGGAVGAGVSGASPMYPTSGNVAIGTAPDAPGLTIQGYIRNVKFYSVRLTNAELQALTGP